MKGVSFQMSTLPPFLTTMSITTIVSMKGMLMSVQCDLCALIWLKTFSLDQMLEEGRTPMNSIPTEDSTGLKIHAGFTDNGPSWQSTTQVMTIGQQVVILN